jgi:hypothetical protein
LPPQRKNILAETIFFRESIIPNKYLNIEKKVLKYFSNYKDANNFKLIDN